MKNAKNALNNKIVKLDKLSRLSCIVTCTIKRIPTRAPKIDNFIL